MFEAGNISRWSAGSIPVVRGLPQWWGYLTDDTIATVEAADYFNLGNSLTIGGNSTFFVGDLLYCVCSDGVTELEIATIDDEGLNVTTTASSSIVPAGSITNLQINAAAAIAFSKLAALTSARILVGSAANVATSVAMSGDATLANTGALTIANLAITNAKVAASAAIDFSKLAALTSGNIIVGSAGTVPTSVAMSGDATIVASGALSLIAAIPRTISVNVTAAQFNGAYAAPHLMLAAPAAGTYYVVHGVHYEFDYGGAQFANGGVMGVQYDSTVNGAGLLAHIGIAAAVVQGVSADFIVGAAGFNIAGLVGGAATGIVAKGLYLSNKTGAFDTGTSDVRVHITYSTVTTSL